MSFTFYDIKRKLLTTLNWWSNLVAVLLGNVCKLDKTVHTLAGHV